MSLKLMYITNQADIAAVAQSCGVDRIFVDMEYIGKSDRQGGMDTVQSHHTIEDVRNVRQVLTTSQLLVRCNPIHDKTEVYPGSEQEIEDAIDAGADIIMLPFFKTVQEVKRFISIVNGRVRTLLLLETPEAAESVDEILAVPGIDEVLIGLNDLSLGYGKPFMFQLLADGTVDRLCEKCRAYGIPYGFGGIASMGKGILPSEYVIKEHYRLNSQCAILSRSFCDLRKMKDLSQVNTIFHNGVRAIRAYENYCKETPHTYEANRMEVRRLVDKIVGENEA